MVSNDRKQWRTEGVAPVSFPPLKSEISLNLSRNQQKIKTIAPPPFRSFVVANVLEYIY